MNRNVNIVIAAGLLILLIAFVVIFSGGSQHYSRDLSYWFRAAAGGDWSSQAAQGEPRAQLSCGLNLIRSNLVVMIDRPYVTVFGQQMVLSRIPLIGKRFFETTSYNIDGRISQQQLAEAYRWVRKAADQGFAPAKEAEKLFAGRVANGQQPTSSDTNRTSAAASHGSP